MALAKTRRYSCIVALGCAIRDETPQFEHVVAEAASGLQLAALETGVPVAFGVLTVDSAEDAEGRVEEGGTRRAALEMADLFTQLRASAARRPERPRPSLPSAADVQGVRSVWEEAQLREPPEPFDGRHEAAFRPEPPARARPPAGQGAACLRLHAVPQGRQGPEGHLTFLHRLRERRIDRLTDRLARRPHGRRARAVYGSPDVHAFAWEPVLAALDLGEADRLLDVGCGEACSYAMSSSGSGAAAQGIDHSREMVRLARPHAVRGDAAALPFADEEFTAVSSIVAFFFFPEPVRVLRDASCASPGGRGAIYTTAPEAKGTEAAPYPLATRGHFYTDEELRQLVLEAGFASSEVTRPDESGWAQLLTAQP